MNIIIVYYFTAHRPPSIPQLLQAAKLYQISNKVPASLYDCVSLSYCLHVSYNEVEYNDIDTPL